MLLLIAKILFWALLLLGLFNTGWIVYLVVILRRSTPPPPRETISPSRKTAVFLCLRGADPHLATCLRRLMSQDHPHYEVMVVVDSPEDPAWSIVKEAIQEFGSHRLRAWSLAERRLTCGLKNSSLVQLLDQLEENHEIVVLADADVQPHATWLRQLVAPLEDSKVGATFGNRWFLPKRKNLGSLVRQTWNAPGLIVMAAFKIPWAGSMAMRRDLIEKGNVREKWSKSIVDDGPIREAAKELGLKLAFVPTLIMANHEVCDLPFAYQFLRRQLTWTRTYVSSLWPLMVGYHLLSLCLASLGILLAVVGVCTQRYDTATWAIFANFASWMIAYGQTLIIDSEACRVIRKQGETVETSFGLRSFYVPLAIALAASFGLIAAFIATFARRIVWRGVTYEIRGPWDVRLVKDSIATPTCTIADASL
ncbi:glycosyltransferase [Planctomycetaceae bacterium SH139]